MNFHKGEVNKMRKIVYFIMFIQAMGWITLPKILRADDARKAVQLRHLPMQNFYPVPIFDDIRGMKAPEAWPAGVAILRQRFQGQLVMSKRETKWCEKTSKELSSTNIGEAPGNFRIQCEPDSGLDKLRSVPSIIHSVYVEYPADFFGTLFFKSAIHFRNLDSCRAYLEDFPTFQPFILKHRDGYEDARLVLGCAISGDGKGSIIYSVVAKANFPEVF